MILKGLDLQSGKCLQFEFKFLDDVGIAIVYFEENGVTKMIYQRYVLELNTWQYVMLYLGKNLQGNVLELFCHNFLAVR